MVVNSYERIEIQKQPHLFWRRIHEGRRPPCKEWLIFLCHTDEKCQKYDCNLRSHFQIHSGFYERKRGFIQAFSERIVPEVRYWAIASDAREKE